MFDYNFDEHSVSPDSSTTVRKNNNQSNNSDASALPTHRSVGESSTLSGVQSSRVRPSAAHLDAHNDGRVPGHQAESVAAAASSVASQSNRRGRFDGRITGRITGRVHGRRVPQPTPHQQHPAAQSRSEKVIPASIGGVSSNSLHRRQFVSSLDSEHLRTKEGRCFAPCSLSDGFDAIETKFFEVSAELKFWQSQLQGKNHDNHYSTSSMIMMMSDDTTNTVNDSKTQSEMQMIVHDLSEIRATLIQWLKKLQVKRDALQSRLKGICSGRASSSSSALSGTTIPTWKELDMLMEDCTSLRRKGFTDRFPLLSDEQLMFSIEDSLLDGIPDSNDMSLDDVFDVHMLAEMAVTFGPPDLDPRKVGRCLKTLMMEKDDHKTSKSLDRDCIMTSVDSNSNESKKGLTVDTDDDHNCVSQLPTMPKQFRPPLVDIGPTYRTGYLKIFRERQELLYKDTGIPFTKELSSSECRFSKRTAQDFEVKSAVGSGQYGKVYLAKTPKPLSVAEMMKRSSQRRLSAESVSSLITDSIATPATDATSDGSPKSGSVGIGMTPQRESSVVSSSATMMNHHHRYSSSSVSTMKPTMRSSVDQKYVAIKTVRALWDGESDVGKRAVHRHSRNSMFSSRMHREGVPLPVIREILALKKLNHNNVLRLYDVVIDKEDFEKFHLILEFVHFDLAKIIEARYHAAQLDKPHSLLCRRNGLMPPAKLWFHCREIKFIIFEILNGLSHLNKCGYLHRDLKPANVLITNKGEVKIADFGLSRVVHSSRVGPFPLNDDKQGSRVRKLMKLTNDHRIVTRWYRAPEITIGDNHYYDFRVDVWSAACILGELIQGTVMFDSEITISSSSSTTTTSKVGAAAASSSSAAASSSSSNGGDRSGSLNNSMGMIDENRHLDRIIDWLGFPSKEEWPDLYDERQPFYAAILKRARTLFAHRTRRVESSLTKTMNKLSWRSDAIEQCCDLLSKLLVFDPRKRLTAEKAIRHRWFTCEKGLRSNGHKLRSVLLEGVNQKRPTQLMSRSDRERRPNKRRGVPPDVISERSDGSGSIYGAFSSTPGSEGFAAVRNHPHHQGFAHARGRGRQGRPFHTGQRHPTHSHGPSAGVFPAHQRGRFPGHPGNQAGMRRPVNPGAHHHSFHAGRGQFAGRGNHMNSQSQHFAQAGRGRGYPIGNQHFDQRRGSFQPHGRGRGRVGPAPKRSRFFSKR